MAESLLVRKGGGAAGTVVFKDNVGGIWEPKTVFNGSQNLSAGFQLNNSQTSKNYLYNNATAILDGYLLYNTSSVPRVTSPFTKQAGPYLHNGFFYYSAHDPISGGGSFARVSESNLFQFTNLTVNVSQPRTLKQSPNYFYFNSFNTSSGIVSHQKIGKSNSIVVRTITANENNQFGILDSTGDINDDETTYFIHQSNAAQNFTSLNAINNTGGVLGFVNFRSVGIGRVTAAMIAQDSSFIYVSTPVGRIKIQKSNYGIVANTLTGTGDGQSDMFEEGDFLYELGGANIRKIHKSNLAVFNTITLFDIVFGSSPDLFHPVYDNGQILFFARATTGSDVYQDLCIYNTSQNTMQDTKRAKFDVRIPGQSHFVYGAGVASIRKKTNGEYMYILGRTANNVGSITPIFNPYIINT
jgi:hypothetical protein